MSTPNIPSSFGFGSSITGLQNALKKVNTSAENIAASDSTSNLTNEIVSQIESKHEFSANLSVIKTKDENLGTLLDLIG